MNVKSIKKHSLKDTITVTKIFEQIQIQQRYCHRNNERFGIKTIPRIISQFLTERIARMWIAFR